MRVLFVSSAGIGHVFPMVPLAWALRAAGHDVLVATTGPGLTAAQAGLPVVDAAPGLDFEAFRRQLGQQRPDSVQQAAGDRPPHDMRQATRLFAQFSRLLADQVVAIAQRWQPELIVQSPLQGAGLLAAAKFDIPLVEHGVGFGRTNGVAELLREHMADVFDRYGVHDLPRRQHSVDVAPPSMAEPQGWPMGYVPYNGGAVLPAWLSAAPQRPRIGVTLGTVAPRMTGVEPLHRLVETAAGLDAEFVLALGDTDTTPLGPLPPNIRAVGWVPLNALLVTCGGLVHHGGAGTTLTALACGVPQLMLPDGADRYINARAVRQRQAGLVASADEVTDTLLEELLHNDDIRRAAQEVQQEISAMPSPSDIAIRLTEFAATSPGRVS